MPRIVSLNFVTFLNLLKLAPSLICENSANLIFSNGVFPQGDGKGTWAAQETIFHWLTLISYWETHRQAELFCYGPRGRHENSDQIYAPQLAATVQCKQETILAVFFSNWTLPLAYGDPKRIRPVASSLWVLFKLKLRKKVHNLLACVPFKEVRNCHEIIRI